MTHTEETDGVRAAARPRRSLDAIDRKILGALAQDATLSFAALGSEVGLSPPATHERVRRLRAAGVIKRTVAVLDGVACGKALLAFIHVDTTGWGKTQAMMALAELPELEEIHSVTGDACLVLKARVASTEALEGLLSRIYDLPEVKGTRTYMTLSTYLERTPQAEITGELAEGHHIR